MKNLHQLHKNLIEGKEVSYFEYQVLFDATKNEFEALSLSHKMKNVKSLLFCIVQIATTDDINQVQLENLISYAKYLKKYTYDSDYYPVACTALHRRLFQMSGSEKRKILSKHGFSVEVETGLILISSLTIDEIEDLQSPHLDSLGEKLIYIETGSDGKCKIELEFINLRYPHLSIPEYKKEIVKISEQKSVKFSKKVYINDGAEQGSKNIIQVEPGEYTCLCYEFHNKFKVIFSSLTK